MQPPEPGTRAELATQVILGVFRANGLLLAAGDALALDHGLTSARWQVIGAIALAQQPLTVPQIARRMGLTRQSVHSSVNRLVRDGMVRLVTNADHKRSQLVELTELGDTTYRAMDAKQTAWVEQLTLGLSPSSLTTTASVLDEFCSRLDTEPPPKEDGP